MTPSKIHLHQKTQILDIEFGSQLFHMAAEYLRVHSPSAEVRGHQGVGGQLPTGKRDVKIQKIEPAGNYAVRLHFDDGHTSGLYTWAYLHELATQQNEYWQTYLDTLHQLNKTRDPHASVLTFKP